MEGICFIYVSFLPVILLWAPCCAGLARVLGFQRKQCVLSLISPLLLPFGLLLALIPGLLSEPLGWAVLVALHFVLCRLSMKHPNPKRMYLYFLLSSGVFFVLMRIT